jgi:hypothetical protein
LAALRSLSDKGTIEQGSRVLLINTSNHVVGVSGAVA